MTSRIPRGRWSTSIATRILVFAVSVVSVASCGNDEPVVVSGSDNVPGQNTRGGQWIEGIPLYPQAESVSDLRRMRGSRTQTFMTDQVGPRLVLRWFERELIRDGWEAIEVAHAIGEESFRGRWRKDGDTLTVAASPGPPLEELRGVERATQFSLVLSEN